MSYPEVLENIEELESMLSEPTPQLVEIFSKLEGEVMVLGVAGKMGPTLTRMARRAFDASGVKRRVIGVARFSNPEEQEKLEHAGIETLRCDLLDEGSLRSLPEVQNVIYMAGMKFGSEGNEAMTWAMNTFLPGMVCQRFPHSRIAAFSTGNIYGLTPLRLAGSQETDAANPMGDYAMSCLGRERIFQHFSQSRGLPVSLIRLNYACELRYGVLVDLAQKIRAGQPIDLTMGHFNVIWQGDANAMALASLAYANSPAFVLNVAGPELLSVRRTCEQLGRLMACEVRFTGAEAPDALLSNGQLGHRLFGYPRVSFDRLVRWVANWISAGRESLGKPTHFETRSGRF